MSDYRQRPIVAVLLLVTVLMLGALRAPGQAAASPSADVAAVPALGQRLPRTCDELQPLLHQVELVDTSLLTALSEPGESGVAACVFLDHRSQQPNVWLLSASSVEQFRARKRQMGDQLAERGLDPCALTFWAAVDNTVQRGLNAADWHDAGRPCEPQIEALGPRSEAQIEVVRTALADAIRVADEQLGWRLTWPLQIQIWDDDTGIRNRGRMTMPEAQDAAGEAAMAIVGTHSRTRIVLDLSRTESEEDLRAVVAHEYAHIVQHGITGCTCNLPFWAVEGGAEFFASLVVGPRSPALADRFQEARERAHTGRARPLSSLTDRRTADMLQPYSRGYAALQFLAERWGAEAFVRLYRDNLDGSTVRYHANLEALTGLNLDDFDAALTEWLKAHPGFIPDPGPFTALAPDSRVYTLSTGNFLDGAFEERSTFGAGQRTAEVRVRWDCLTDESEVIWTVFDPEGNVAARYRGLAPAGCLSGSYISIDLDERLGGAPPRSRPGLWRAELSLHGVPQGSVTFTVQPWSPV